MEELEIDTKDKNVSQKLLYNYILNKMKKEKQVQVVICLNEIKKLFSLWGRSARPYQAISSLNNSGVASLEKMSKSSIVYKATILRDSALGWLTKEQKEVLLFLKSKDDNFSADALSHRLAIEYYKLVEALKGLKKNGLVDLSIRNNDKGNYYFVSNTASGVREGRVVYFFRDRETREKEKKEKKIRTYSMDRNNTLAGKIKSNKEKEADIKQYGVSVDDNCLIKFSSFERTCQSIYKKLCEIADELGVLADLKAKFMEATKRAKTEIVGNNKFYYKDKFPLTFGKHGLYLVSVIFTRAYYFDYAKQEMAEAVGIEKIACNIIRVAQFKQGVTNEN